MASARGPFDSLTLIRVLAVGWERPGPGKRKALGSDALLGSAPAAGRGVRCRWEGACAAGGKAVRPERYSGDAAVLLLFRRSSHGRTYCDPADCQPARPLCPWDFAVRNAAVGRHLSGGSS